MSTTATVEKDAQRNPETPGLDVPLLERNSDPSRTPESATILENAALNSISANRMLGVDITDVEIARSSAREYELKGLFVNKKDESEIAAGELISAGVAISPGGAGVLRFHYNGNNHQASVAGDAVFELAFRCPDLETIEAVNDFKLQLKAIIDASVEQPLTRGVSIAEQAGIRELLPLLNEGTRSIAQLQVENLYLSGSPETQELFSRATLGGITATEAVLDPGRVSHAPALKNCIIENLELGGITGKISNSRLSDLNVRSGAVHLETDFRSRIERLDAVGASVSGTINCFLSGDFRRAALGTARQALSGLAFTITEDRLVPSRKISDFVFDVHSDTGEPPTSYLLVNGKKAFLDIYKERKRFESGSLSEIRNRSELPLGPTIETDTDFKQAAEKFVEFSSIANEARVNDTLTVEFTLVADADSPPSRVSCHFRSTAEGSATTVTPDLTPERALFLLKQLQDLPADIEILKYHQACFDMEERNPRWTDSSDAQPLAGATRRKKRSPDGFRMDVLAIDAGRLTA